jgi:hypothetical protein
MNSPKLNFSSVPGFGRNTDTVQPVSTSAGGPGTSQSPRPKEQIQYPGSLSSVEEDTDIDDTYLHLECLSKILFDSGIRCEQQEQALELLEQLSREVQPDTYLTLPISVVTVRPMSLKGPEAPLKSSPEEQKRWETARTQAFQSRQPNNGIEQHIDVELSSEMDLNCNLEKKPPPALFYDPFEARRNRSKNSEDVVLWSVGASCTATVVFRNPLSTPTYLTAVTLLIEGVDHVCTPRSVLLSPKVGHRL